MSVNIFFILILVILVLDYGLERYLAYLNSTCLTDELPAGLKGIFDDEKYRMSQQYERVKQKFGLYQSSVTFILMIVMLLSGGFGWLDNFIRHFTNSSLLLALGYFGLIGLASAITGLPFDIYYTFVIEEKFGFNLTTVKTFILDRIKGMLLGVVIGSGLISLIILVYNSAGNDFWWMAWVLITVFMLFMTMFWSNLILPLFNKQRPLEVGPLKDAIEAFAGKARFRMKNIYVIDGSRRSKKSNAYFTGLGVKKRVVLYDTLIRDHTIEELVAVLAHEIGHYKKKHTLTGIILSVLQTGLMLFILSLFLRKDSAVAQSLCQALSGFSGIAVKQSFHVGILTFGLLYSPFSFVLGLIMNQISRKHEYAADRYAGTHYNPLALMNALKKLSVNNLSNLNPHPAYVFFYYSHPTLLQRLQALKRIL